ncbi:Influenza virus NS1A-binding protein-like protein [Hypsibius exemplaris]|uniref:Influenza virus NS1A-binding protein-like protein n=1 Tax=Hypsibius exemplaris TaxID=2072580 RepID=A0A1W0WPW7_HYPEX|nr:Influenza virus NS1A-binding protein-like protein [Hypsibius exemplaris]
MEIIDSESDLLAVQAAEEFSFADDEAQIVFGNQLNVLRRNREFCDVVLSIGQHEIAGHKCVLAVAIPRLFLMFSKDARQTYELDELDIDYESVETLVEFAYTYRLIAKPEDVKKLFRAAAKLQMDRVVQACGAFLIAHVKVSSCVGVRSIINREYTSSLADDIDAFIKENFAEIVVTPDFISLPRVQIEVIQKSEQEANQTNELQLCQMGVDWVRKCVVDEDWTLDSVTEKVHLLFLKDDDNTLHDCVELSDLDKEFNRETCVQDYKVLSKTKLAPLNKNGSKASRGNSLNRNPVRSRQLLYSGHTNGSGNGHTHSDINLDIKWKIIAVMQTADRTHIALAVADRKLVALSVVQRVVTSNGNGTNGSGDNGNHVQEENGNGHKMESLAVMRAARCAFGASCFGDKIVVAGGYNRGECLATAEVFDPKRNEWTFLAPMLSPRARFDIAVLGQNVYAVCGSDGSKDLQTAECYDFETKAWETIASLSSPRSSAGVCALEDRVICVGGWTGQTVMKCVDAYDPSVDQWLPYSPLQTSRSQAGVDVLDGRIYVVGGCDQWDRLCTVEAYDPRSDTWSFVAPLSSARRGAGVTHHGGKLYVIGGSDGTQSLTTVEIYDPRTNRWSSGPSLSISRSNLECVELDGQLFAIGGYSGKVFLNSLEVLDSTESEWTEFITL